MEEADPSNPKPTSSPDAAGGGRAKRVSIELGLSLGGKRDAPLAPIAVSRVAESPRALLERWRLTPEGRVRDTGATEVHCIVASVIHLWPILASVIGPFSLLAPLVLWLAFRGRSPLVDDHGREAMNAMLTLAILALVPCFGWIVLVAWVPVQLVSLVRAAVAGGSGELFRYPVILRPIR